MDKAKREKLEKAGIVVTEVERLRRENGLTQKALAEQIGTKQPAVARMVSNPSSTTIDSLMKALLSLGSTPRKIAALL